MIWPVLALAVALGFALALILARAAAAMNATPPREQPHERRLPRGAVESRQARL